MLVEEFVDFLTSVMWSPGVVFFFSLSLYPIFDIHSLGRPTTMSDSGGIRKPVRLRPAILSG